MTINFPYKAEFTTHLIDRPRYVGSIHDNSAASRYGYRSALVPGDHLYGFMSQLAVLAWGEDWLLRGIISSRSRRPVYNNQKLVVETSSLVKDDNGCKVNIDISNEDGDIVAIGWIGLPDVAPSPPLLSEYPILRVHGEKPSVARGEIVPGQRLFACVSHIDGHEHQAALDEFQETWRVYSSKNIIPAARLLREALRDEIASFSYPTPSIFISAAAQHFGIAHVGDVLSTSSVITDTYQRNGGDYFACMTLLIANGDQPIALFDRRTLYAAKSAS
ncbi:hypothetical protein ACNSPG_12235 [Brucella pituitosa]|uniref:hypothetical protein n=1 Tax=Brucella pituitosa TaxID=571256 RepID=UPI003C758D54